MALGAAATAVALAANFQPKPPVVAVPAPVSAIAVPSAPIAEPTPASSGPASSGPASASPAPKPLPPVAAASAPPVRATQTAARVVDPPVVARPITPPPAPAVAPPSLPPADRLPATLQQLDALLAPIALYPDQLLSQILMAATYPLEVVEAARWASRPESEGLQGDYLARALEGQDWEPSVKALAAFPHVLKMLDSDLVWLAKLGEAFLAQETEVMDAVQRLRLEAKAADQLNSNAQRAVTVANKQIIIEPANPQVVYVPIYDPRTSYGVWPYSAYPPAYFPPPLGYAYTSGIYYSFGSISPFWGWSSWDWPNRRIRIIDVPRYTHHNRGRGPIDNGVWRHDPDHRRGVQRGDRFDRAIDMRRKPDPPQVVNLPQPGSNNRRPRGPELNDPNSNGDRQVDQVQPIRPSYRGTQPGEPGASSLPGALPDLSPPLAAGVDLPDVTPSLPTPVALPDVPPQTTTSPNRDPADNFRTRRQIQPGNAQPGNAQPGSGDDETRRLNQFQDRSIDAPVLRYVPPPMAAEAPAFQPQPMRPAPQAIAPEPNVQQPNFRQPGAGAGQGSQEQDEGAPGSRRSRGDRTADD